MKTITIVGGGTAGYITALILKTRYGSNIDLQLVKSNKIGIIGVGEGSTEHWKEFMDFVGIDFKELINECDATLKCGIMFKNWTDNDYLHNVNELKNFKHGQHLASYLKLMSEDCDVKELNNPWFWENKVGREFLLSELHNCPTNQYHFNTFKLNEFLNKKSIEKGLKVVDDEIVEVELNNKGEISKLKGEKNNYDTDFYIDCTGFKRLLISKLGAQWKSYSKYLKMKEAIAFPTDGTDEYNVYTIARAMKYGWAWHIPTYGRWGNGYIFDSDYINADDAKQEIEETLGHKIDIGKHVKFDPGCLDKPWIKNCLAVGLSANFVEPLEATSIGTSINQMFLFIHMFDNYNQKIIDDYNYKMELIMNNIRDFIILHYITKRDDTSFWKDLKTMKIPDTLKDNIERWQTRLPIRDDFRETNYYLFLEHNYAQILYALDLLNKENIKILYNSFNEEHRKHFDVGMNEYKNNLNVPQVKHKTYLKAIRAMYAKV